jgi:hypothetical protein
MAEYIWERVRQVAFIKDGIAFDRQNKERYRVEGDKLLNLETGEVVAYLTQAGRHLQKWSVRLKPHEAIWYYSGTSCERVPDRTTSKCSITFDWRRWAFHVRC